MRKILVVDDHAILRHGIISILERHFAGEVVCREAASAREAEEKLAAEEFQLMLLDVSLPKVSGLELLGRLRRQYPALRVLVVSMHPEAQYALRAISLGAAGYLTKESAPDELLLAVERVLGGGRYITASLADRLADYLLAEREREKLPHELLSNRERQVMLMIGAGKATKEIAYELAISDKTVSTYRARVLRKLAVTGTAGLMKYVIKHDLLN